MLRTYRTFKTVFAWEHYLSAVTNRSHLIALARFQTSCHGLQIEVGRYHKPPIPPELHYCTVCKSGEVENECHFIHDCKPLEQFWQDLHSITTSAWFQCNYSMTCLHQFLDPCIAVGNTVMSKSRLAPTITCAAGG